MMNHIAPAVAIVFVAVLISFGLQALGVDATLAQIISFGWLFVAMLVERRYRRP